MRLLITDGEHDIGRWVEVTGLGKGVDSAGSLSEARMDMTIHVLEEFGRKMDEHDVERRLAMATSASREASNRDLFFDRVERALGVRPTLISGETEGRYAYSGATAGLSLDDPVVSDIGGGSTELVTADSVQSIEMGTVRLADRALPERPASPDALDRARVIVAAAFSGVEVAGVNEHVGVAGTWTSLVGVSLGLEPYDPEAVHGSRLTIESVEVLVDRLSRMTLEETRRIPGLDPKRAPVILPGAMIAHALMVSLGFTETIVSERDTLDGAAMELIGIA